MKYFDPLGLWCEISHKGKDIKDHWPETVGKDYFSFNLIIPFGVGKYEATDCAPIPLPPLPGGKRFWADSICFPPPLDPNPMIFDFYMTEWRRVDHYKVSEVYLEECYDDCTGELISREFMYSDPYWTEIEGDIYDTTYWVRRR